VADPNRRIDQRHRFARADLRRGIAGRSG
jgi:hypothetical protein